MSRFFDPQDRFTMQKAANVMEEGTDLEVSSDSEGPPETMIYNGELADGDEAYILEFNGRSGSRLSYEVTKLGEVTSLEDSVENYNHLHGSDVDAEEVSVALPEFEEVWTAPILDFDPHDAGFETVEARTQESYSDNPEPKYLAEELVNAVQREESTEIYESNFTVPTENFESEVPPIDPDETELGRELREVREGLDGEAAHTVEKARRRIDYDVSRE